MSAGVRAWCTNTTSAGSREPWIVRSIDITGVMPLPADRKRYRSAGWCAVLNRPRGPATATGTPGRRWSCSQLDTGPPGTRLTVIVSSSGRLGADAMV